ncbi:peptidoglycan recognition protein 3-like [Macrosteles quadrilineatus]|uniref:peptidoglycan recognition protein 3-like n=1 Tax=Macrosteles quadrilineatus TaxID=74068 RepID=UPI0023E0F3DB|nr:peptidoglycan recognition protein 3-like [Macrosteles quadrilineatus]
MPLKLFERSTWDPNPMPKSNFFVQIPAQFVWLMNTNSDQCFTQEACSGQLRDLLGLTTKMHHLKDLRYNFLIGDDGNVYEAKGWYHAPLLPLRFARSNCYSLLIAFIGKQSVINLSEAAAEQLGDLIEFGIENGLIKRDFELKNIMVAVRSGGLKTNV